VQEEIRFVLLQVNTSMNIQEQENFLDPIFVRILSGKNIEQSVYVRQLTSRMNGLMKVCARGSPGTRLKVASGIFFSKLCYLIELCGGCEDYLSDYLQILQKFWFTPTRFSWQTVNGSVSGSWYHTTQFSLLT
jgi:hypothetical protein